jgi:hypothetical protein
MMGNGSAVSRFFSSFVLIYKKEKKVSKTIIGYEKLDQRPRYPELGFLNSKVVIGSKNSPPMYFYHP